MRQFCNSFEAFETHHLIKLFVNDAEILDAVGAVGLKKEF